MILLLLTGTLLLLLLLSSAIAWEALHPPRRTAAWAIANRYDVDPADLSLEFTSTSLERPDGTTLALWDIALTESNVRDSQRPVLLLLHGWGRSRIDSLRRLPALREAFAECPPHGSPARALLIDLRGHGESGGATRLGAIEVADVLALIGDLDAPVLLAGHSMGAVIAIHVAAMTDAASRITGVIAWAPYEHVGVPMALRLAARHAPARPFTDLALLWLRLFGVRRVSTRAAASRVTAPLLVLQGTQDRVSPLEDARAIAGAAPRGTFVELPEGNHADAHEIASAEHARALRAFLESSLKPDAPSVAQTDSPRRATEGHGEEN